MLEQGNGQIGSAQRAEVALVHDDVSGDLCEGQDPGAVRTLGNRVIRAKRYEQGSLVRLQHRWLRPPPDKTSNRRVWIAQHGLGCTPGRTPVRLVLPVCYHSEAPSEILASAKTLRKWAFHAH